MIGNFLERVYTGIDGEKTFSVSHGLFRKTWSASNAKGTGINVVPSDLCLIKIEQAFTKSISKLRSYFGLEIESKFGDLPFDLSLAGDRVYIALHRYPKAKDYSHIELEPFALARLLSLLTDEGIIIDIGRRKTTFVQIEKGFLKSYRVIMDGTDYLIDLITRKRDISGEDAKSLLINKGLELNEVKEGIESILKQSGYRLNETKVLLCGGGANLKGLGELFSNTIQNNFCKPELASAFGASLKYVLTNPYPTFQFRALSKEDLRKVTVLGGLSLVLFFASLFAIDKLYSIQNLREIERAEFKKTFPNTPIVSLHEQIRSKVSAGDKYALTRRLKELSQMIDPGMKIISFDYSDGILRIKGEAESQLSSKIKAKSIKQTPKGIVEFEMELK